MTDSEFILLAAFEWQLPIKPSNIYIATFKSNFKSKQKCSFVTLTSYHSSVKVHHIDTAGIVVSGIHYLIRR